MRQYTSLLLALIFLVSGCASSSSSTTSQSPMKDGKVAGPAEDFATGWLQSNGTVTGRPAGLTIAPDGSLFISDDTHNIIYHIWYRE